MLKKAYCTSWEAQEASGRDRVMDEKSSLMTEKGEPDTRTSSERMRRSHFEGGR